MPDRAGLISRFLAETDHAGWTRTPIAGDASRRRYERLQNGDRSRILMDAAPETGEDTRPFLAIARHLRGRGLAAPDIVHADPEAGLLLLEDLGPSHFADHLRTRPDDEIRLYTAATDVLAELQRHAPPPGLQRLDPTTGAEMLAPLFEWRAAEADAPAIRAATAAALARCRAPEALSLRDFHAENLVWRPERDGTDRVGLLDFQDAFLAPPAYDLASLLDDARRDIAEATREAATRRFAELTGTAHAELTAELATLSVQRNLRILGIFARLIARDGKDRYAAFVPRVEARLAARLVHPALADLRRLVGPWLPC
ncbi:hypothetical protein OG2516_11176 [Oceanicola granulosus HTCC2516]|uniref:Aminoglycoside phosphotransferase domain-containing protein n=1 Tax=Oceanicola granulosus (strain ATCC BAA-861 / DSM 15982 / KCTC 12143 / HTCC2516) TaxID=314256 RepID=Q2CJW8_OCEGH|nr:phosphotransferase [Oceanicola granulosus]EAR53021.1 hypothetical protein OG2516_11176 [Oceanicola granulosus HTCC2516]